MKNVSIVQYRGRAVAIPARKGIQKENINVSIETGIECDKKQSKQPNNSQCSK
jgi:hypothetical protein